MKIYLYIFSALLTGCSSVIPTISESDVARAQSKWSDITLDQLRFDREMYILKCSGCHSLYKPNRYSENHWDSILVKMNIKAKLKKNESEQVKRYLMLFSAVDSIRHED